MPLWIVTVTIHSARTSEVVATCLCHYLLYQHAVAIQDNAHYPRKGDTTRLTARHYLPLALSLSIFYGPLTTHTLHSAIHFIQCRRASTYLVEQASATLPSVTDACTSSLSRFVLWHPSRNLLGLVGLAAQVGRGGATLEEAGEERLHEGTENNLGTTASCQ